MKGLIEAATFSNVKGECKEASASNFPWATEWTAGTQRLNLGNGGSGNPRISFKGCTAFNIACEYELPMENLWALVGGNPLKFHESRILWQKVGGSTACLKTGEWDGEGELSEPSGLVHLVASP